MKKIEQVLSSGQSFYVDSIACMLHAEKIKKYKRPREIFLWSEKPKEVQLIFKVAFISVCHQFNWDVMQSALAENLLKDDENIIDTLINVSHKDLQDWLSHYPKKERIKAQERSKILRDVGHVFREKFGGDINSFYEFCNNSSLDKIPGKDSFHDLMDNFLGYKTDRLKKKTNVLSHDLIKEKIISFADPDKAKPAVDYHIMRLYIRTGRVVPSDETIFKFLEGTPNPRGTLVRQLREAVAEAEQLVAYYSKLNVADVNYIEWQLARNICKNKVPQCKAACSENIPEDISSLFTTDCPYIEVCLSYNELPRFINFEEPIYISTDY